MSRGNSSSFEVNELTPLKSKSQQSIHLMIKTLVTFSLYRSTECTSFFPELLLLALFRIQVTSMNLLVFSKACPLFFHISNMSSFQSYELNFINELSPFQVRPDPWQVISPPNKVVCSEQLSDKSYHSVSTLLLGSKCIPCVRCLIFSH